MKSEPTDNNQPIDPLPDLRNSGQWFVNFAESEDELLLVFLLAELIGKFVKNEWSLSAPPLPPNGCFLCFLEKGLNENSFHR